VDHATGIEEMRKPNTASHGTLASSHP
jgi:hypothetical protein